MTESKPPGDDDEAERPAGETCLDCEAPLTGPYCARCGQKAGPARTTLRQLTNDLLSETFELDGRVPRTLVPFLIRPGFLTAEYNAGRRRRYTAPLRLFLGMGVLWVITTFAIGQWRPPDPAETEGWSVQLSSPEDPGRLVRALGLEGSPTGAKLQARINAFETLPKKQQVRRVQRAAVEVVPTVLLGLLPLFTLVLKLLLLGSGRSVPEHAIFALHLHAFALLLFILLRISGGAVAANAVGFTVLAVYTTLALRRAYGLQWFGTLWRAAILGIGAVTVTVTAGVLAVISSALAG